MLSVQHPLLVMLLCGVDVWVGVYRKNEWIIVVFQQTLKNYLKLSRFIYNLSFGQIPLYFSVQFISHTLNSFERVREANLSYFG